MKRNSSSSLTSEQNYLLSIAALFDGDFSIEWLENLLDMKASQLLRALDESIEKKWIVKMRPGVYRFSDLNKQQTLRKSLPREKKMKLHGIIADTMLKANPSGPDAIKAAAEHLLQTDNDINGLRLLLKAGNLYRKSHISQSAIHCYHKILSDLKKIESGAAYDLFIATAICNSKVSSIAPDSDEVDTTIAYLNEALVRAEDMKSRDDVALLKLHLARNQWISGQYDRADENYNQAYLISKDIDNLRLKRYVDTYKPFWHFWRGQFNEAVLSYEELTAEMESDQPQKLPLVVPNMIGICYAHIGRYSQGLGMLNTIHSYSREIGDIDMFCFTGTTIGSVLIDMAQISKAINYLENAFAEDRDRMSDWVKCWRTYTLAYAYFRGNDIAKSQDYLTEYMELNREKRFNAQYLPYLFEICWAMEKGIYPRINDISLESEINDALQAVNIYFRGVAYRYKGLLDFRKGRSHDEVLESFHKSLDLLSTAGHQMEMAKTKLAMGRFFLNIGDEKNAKDLVKSASDFLLPVNESLMPDDLFHLAKDIRKEDNILAEILNLGQEITSITDTKKLGQQILSAVNRITGAERGAIFLLDSTTTPPTIKLKSSRNLRAEEINQTAFKSSLELVKIAAEQGKPIIKDMDSKQADNLYLNNTVHSCICVPMIFQENTVGVLYNDNSMLKSVFKESDLKMFTYFASQAAISLLNAKVYEELQIQNEQLKDEKDYFEKITTESNHSEDFIFRSDVMTKVLDHAMQVSKTDSTVLILGETGVGKEMVAREIHKKSPRWDKPFISVHCSALAKDLLSSELFGHEKGSFSGAVARRIGRFELANGGTLFLDEIGDLSLDLQIKLLRVLQNKEFERVGGEKTLHSDFRLLAATNRDVLQEVKNGNFREDLYYRINVYPIYIPPLRERKDDITLIANHYLKIYAKKFGKLARKIREEDMRRLVNYDWPGNVRELINVIERSTILSSGHELNIVELSSTSQDHARHGTNRTLAENERIHIAETLKRTNGKIRGKGGAAEVLGINYSTLYARMKKLGINKTLIFN